MSSYKLICGDCFEMIPKLGVFDCLIADPPDAIGLKYRDFQDTMSIIEYRNFLWKCLNLFVNHANTSWVSYNAKWTFMVGALVDHLLDENPNIEAKPFVCTFTFGQNRKTDCGNGHRPLLRLRRENAPRYPNQIKVPSWRQLNGDRRAAKGGRVPLDHWEFPRVTGNSKQRRNYHPTQLHEGLVERCINFSTVEDDSVLDVFSGTGTVIRVCKNGLDRNVTSIEIDPFYCEKIAGEHNLEIEYA